MTAAQWALVGLGAGLLVAAALAGRAALQLRHLRAAAAVDPKTGLLNAVAWERAARRELAVAARAARPVAVLLVDIDHFKRVNDRFGHLAGDEVLRRVGAVLRSGVRAADTVGRFGGEEFVAVLPGAGDVDALAVAERLRHRIRAVRPAGGDPISVSIGASCAPTDGVELATLLTAADRALYRAKEHGRDRVVLAQR
jgi:diguanylate cyclase (GGDEF)-like protein